MRAHHFHIRQMRHNLPDTPFPRRNREVLLVAEDPREDNGEQLRTAAEAFE